MICKNVGFCPRYGNVYKVSFTSGEGFYALAAGALCAKVYSVWGTFTIDLLKPRAGWECMPNLLVLF